MIVTVNSLEWPSLFKSREAESSGKPFKQRQLEEERQPVPSSVLTYCVNFKYFLGVDFGIHGTENMLHFASSDLSRFCESIQNHVIILVL